MDATGHRPRISAGPSAAVPPVRLSHLMRSQSGLFTRDQAIRCGYSPYQIRRRMRSGEWQVVCGPVLAGPGLRLTVALRDIAALLAVAGSVLAGPSAARRHGIPVADQRCYLAVPASIRVRLPGVRVLRDTVPPRDLVVIDGIPVTGRARTVFDCLRVLPDDEAQRLLATARRSGWIGAGELAEHLHRFTGRRGAKRLARLCRSASGASAPPGRPPLRVVLFETDRVAVELVRKAGWAPELTPTTPLPARFAPSDLVDRPTVVLATLRAALDGER